MTNIDALSRELYANARDKGFYEHEDKLRATHEASLADPESDTPFWEAQLAEHFGNRFMLIAGEAIEAHEEIRSGHGVAELYFSGDHMAGEGSDGLTPHPVASYNRSILLKPEGVLAELADVVIRSLETMQSILDQADSDQMTKLRGQVPESEATKYANETYGATPMPVSVAEVILLKHRFNLSRAPKHGGKAF